MNLTERSHKIRALSPCAALYAITFLLSLQTGPWCAWAGIHNSQTTTRDPRPDSDCGQISLSVLTWLIGRKVPYGDIIKQLPINSEGTSFYEIRQAAQKLGIPLEGWRMTLEELRSHRLPAIVQINGDHFTCVDRIFGSYVRVYEHGAPHLIEISKFTEMFNSYVLLMPGEFQKEVQGSHARLTMNQTFIDLGELAIRQGYLCSFRIRNSGTSPLVLSKPRIIGQIDGCRLRDYEVLPSSSVEVRYLMWLKSPETQIQYGHIIFETNDPIQPVLVVT